jgi:hypothetical protein
MASGRDFAREIGEGEQDALIGIQTRGGTILRGTTVPPSPGDPAEREGTRRTPRTCRERSPPSPVRSGHQDWPTLQGTDPVARGRLGAPELRRPEDDRNSPFRAAEEAPPGFTVLAAGPTLNLRPEWLSNPRGTPQRTPGGTFGHGQQDAQADQLGAPRPRGRDAPRKIIQRYGTSRSRLQRASDLRRAIGATLQNAKPRQSWRGRRVFLCTCKCPKG